MKKNTGLLVLLTAVFLGLALLGWTQEPEEAPEKVNNAPAFSVLVTANGETEQIRCWQRQDGNFYVFLPSYARLSETVISLDASQNLLVDGIPLTDGMSCGNFQLGMSYPVEWNGQKTTLQFVRSGNMPALHIDTASGTMDHIHAKKGNAESGKLRLYNADGSLSHGSSLEALTGRGNSTWDQIQKPYNLKFSSQTDLLGMGAAQRWVLLANYTDRSNLRNKIVFDFADAAGLPYSPQSQWVDLYLNGEYAGLYQLCEKNELHPQRVDQPKDSSFLVSIEVLWRLEAQEYPHFVTDSNTAVRVHQGDPEALLARFQTIENAVMSENGIDPVTGQHYTALVDLDSWVRKFLVEEIFGNGDASALSQFFYGSTNGSKVFAGPVWDYDVSMGLDAWRMSVPNVFYANRPYLRKNMEQNWFHGLYQKQEFYDRLVTLYREEMRPLLETLLETGIADYASQVSQAARMNQLRWSAADPAEEAEKIQTYLTGRMAFLDAVWLNDQEYCLVTMDLSDGSNAVCFVLSPGDTIPSLPDISSLSNVLGWYDLATGEPIDVTQPIYEDTVITLKYQEPEIIWFPEEPQETQAPLRRRTLMPLALLLVFLMGAALVDWKQSRS